MKFPSLELTFAEDGGHQILVDASFRLDATTAVSRRLVIHPPKKKTFRALCILMLLAKYRSQPFADEKGFIWFKDKSDRQTWIKTLGGSFGKKAQDEFFKDYFSKHDFLWAGRGSGHTEENKLTGKGQLPSAYYKSKRLPLDNLVFYKAKREASGVKPILIEGEELAVFAGQLERYKSGTPGGWEPIVPDIIADTKKDRPIKSEPCPEKISFENVEGSQPFFLSTRWRELNVNVRKQVAGRANGGDWFVVSVVPGWVLEWKGILCDAVMQHNAKVKFAYQSPAAARKCSAVKAQLLMNSGRAGSTSKEVFDYLHERIESLKVEIGGWPAEPRKQSVSKRPSKGSFEFFESNVNHPFMGMLWVPPGSKRPSVGTAGAPPGTWCLLGLYPFYQRVVDSRCCLFLNDASPMLDVYYNTILDFFEHGLKDGYLQAVNLPATRQRRKSK